MPGTYCIRRLLQEYLYNGNPYTKIFLSGGNDAMVLSLLIVVAGSAFTGLQCLQF